MNERIRKLAEQARKALATDALGGGKFDMQAYEEKFAELIVKECAQYMYKHYPHSRYEINYMRKHMGDADWNKPIGVE